MIETSSVGSKNQQASMYDEEKWTDIPLMANFSREDMIARNQESEVFAALRQRGLYLTTQESSIESSETV